MLLAMTVIVVEVVPLVFQGIERLIFNFPPCSPPSHQLADVVLRHSKVRYPAEMLDFVLAHLPVLNEIHSHVGARLVEWHVIDKAKLMCNACGAVMPLISGKASLSLGHLHLLKQIRMIACFAPKNVVTAVIVQGFNVRRIGTESIFGDNKPEMGMVLAQLGNEAFGGIALTIVFLAAILFDDRLRHQRNDFTPVGMNECGTEHLMQIGHRAVTVMLFETRLTMDRFGGKISSAVKGQQITPLKKHHLVQRFPALKLSKDRLERRPQGLGGKRIQNLSHVGVARGTLNAVDRFQVGFCPLVVIVEKRWTFE